MFLVYTIFNNISVVITTKKEKSMEKYYHKIKNSPLFYGMTDFELEKMLKCFNAYVKKHEAGDMIIRQGDVISKIFLILDGEVNIEKETYWGRRMIIQKLYQNNNIGLSLVASSSVESNINALSVSDSLVLVLNYEKCSRMCQNACSHHAGLIRNLFNIISKENIELIEKIENISQKTIRDKLLTYLSNESIKNKSNSFEIQFNRQELADYLNIDRSAMSFELSKLKNEGLIDYNKNKFVLKAQL